MADTVVEKKPSLFREQVEMIENEARLRAALLVRLDALIGGEAFSEAIHRVNGDTLDYSRWVAAVEIYPEGEAAARRIVGALIFGLGVKPTYRKSGERDIEARFELEQITVSVRGYKTKNCRLVEKEVVIPAKEEEVIPAEPERVEKQMVLECDPVEGEPEAEDGEEPKNEPMPTDEATL